MTFLQQAFGTDSIEIRKSIESREAAILASGELLIASGRVRNDYLQSMLDAIDQFGPYMVIAPGIALAHGKPSDAVIETGLSLLVLEQAIEFKHSQNDPVQLVFGLAATNHDSHIGLMSELADFLSDHSNVNFLITCTEVEQIRTFLGNELGQ